MLATSIIQILAVFFSALGVYFLIWTVYTGFASYTRGKGIKIYTVIEVNGDAPSLERCVRAAAAAGDKMLTSGEIYIIDKGMSAETRSAAELMAKDSEISLVSGRGGVINFIEGSDGRIDDNRGRD